MKRMPFLALAAVWLGLLQWGWAQDAELGKKLFQQNCSACHKLGAKLVGPDLIGVTERRDESWLIQFIQNSQALIEAGDEQAVAIFEEFNKMVMPPQPLSEEEIRSVLAYIESEGGGGAASAAPTGGGGSGGAVVDADAVAAAAQQNMMRIYHIVVGLTLFFIVFLLLLLGHFKRQAWEREHPGEPYPGFDLKAYLDFASRYVAPVPVAVMVLGVLSLVMVVVLYVAAQDIGLQQGYAPDQPVKFSHELHAGQLQIDCQYCHTGVEKSKNANIPSVNICMNCHTYVSEGPKYGTTEIAKVRKAAEEGRPIEWVRVHNLPEHAYFSHAQHVKVGGIECQTCHGPVETMEKVRQVATLEMKWCVNCHKATDVQFDNPYYKATFGDKYDEIKAHRKIKVADLGGLDCARCHY